MFLSDASVKGIVTSDADVSLLSADISQESAAGRMASTPVQGHPAAIDISDVISSIYGDQLCI